MYVYVYNIGKNIGKNVGKNRETCKFHNFNYILSVKIYCILLIFLILLILVCTLTLAPFTMESAKSDDIQLS